MNRSFVEDKTFKGINYGEEGFLTGDYEECTFLQCNLSNSDLSTIVFVECRFIDCDMSMVRISGTAFRETIFKDCKLLGLHFENCNDILFSVEFINCDLNLSSFFTRSLTSSSFTECKLREVDFTEADLTGTDLKGCDLTGSVFNNTVLEKADLRTSFNYSIDPEINRIRKARFSAGGVTGLLDKYDITID
ncbi:MAG: pentapeptide repeat-containing protein [Bacteroidales bacterium]|nr:pentapeptide repeat-containing protein [Bacteroidales bacterium]